MTEFHVICFDCPWEGTIDDVLENIYCPDCGSKNLR